MTRIVPLAVLVAVAVGVFALTTAGGSEPSHASGPRAAPRAAVNVRSTPLGTILVNADGSTLYLFEADKPNKSTCSGACVSAWPPLISDTTPTAAPGTQAAKLGTIATAGGRRQVTYNGHPLYLYVGDQKAGDTKGQGLDQFGAEWYVLSPSGDKIDED
jgi:predicted lipoprotein with Yx(FWY)xxD motif